MKLCFQERDYLTEQLAEIRHPNNSTKLVDINSIRRASSKRLTERKEAVPAGDCVARYIYDTS